jgi:hypothetical protein
MSVLRQTSPLTVPVPCHGERHQLLCEDGQLLAPDHPDVEGELTLTALGGESTPCAELVSAWRSSADDLRVLTLTERSAADRLQRPPVEVLFASSGPQGGFMQPSFGVPSPTVMPPGFARARARSGWGRTYAVGGMPVRPPMPGMPGMAYASSRGSPAPARPDPLVRLLAMGSALTQRLVAEVVTTWTGRIARADAPASAVPALSAALAGRARAALSEWIGRPFGEIRVNMLDPGSAASIEFSDALVVGLPFAWLGDVWLPGLSQLLLGRFTLAASEAGDTVTLDTVDTSLHRRNLTIKLS